MSKKEQTKDYSKYTYRENQNVLINANTYDRVKAVLFDIAKYYKRRYPGSWKQNMLEEIIKTFLQHNGVEGQSVKFPAPSFLAIREAMPKVLEEEIVLLTGIQKENVNINTGKAVKTVPKNKKQNYREVFSAEKTAEANLKQYITNYGQAILKLNNTLNDIHFDNVDSGLAVTYQELEKERDPNPEEKKPEVVENAG